MPEFTPNDFMLNKQANRGEEPWEIYAECVRDAMCKHGKFAKSDRPIREKLAYEEFMNCRTDEVTIDGVQFAYPTKASKSQENDDYALLGNESE